MSTEEQFTARLRRLGEEIAAPTPVDPEALAARAVRRVRYRRVAVPVVSAVTAVAVVAVAAVALPDAGRSPLPGTSASPVEASPSASASVSPTPEPAPSPTPSSDFTYQAVNVPDGWRSTGITGLAFAVPEVWEDLDRGGMSPWQNADWQDGVASDASMAAMEKARADYVAEHGHEPEPGVMIDSGIVVPKMWVFAGTYKAGGDVAAPVLRNVDLSVPGADVAHMRVGPDVVPGMLTLELTIHQPDGLWYNFHGSLPAGDAGLAMADAMAASFVFMATGPEILATLPSVDDLPVLEIAHEVPAGWVEHETHGLSYALPAEYARDTRAFSAGDRAVGDWSSAEAIAPGLPGNVTVIWSPDHYIPSQEPGPTERRLEIEGANLATTVWSEGDLGEPVWPGEVPAWPKGTLVATGSAIVERADGAGRYSVSWMLPPGSGALILQLLGTLRIS